MIKKYQNFLNEEVGLKNISKIAKLYKTAEIYFHKDLDGVTSAIAMKEFLKNYYQIETVDCHIIQYGGLEYAIKHHKEGNLCVLVDFAHGKPMFHIATDHHDKQSGAEETQSTYFKQTRSNVETISGEISYADIFTHEDIELIKTVDSANFIANNIKPEDVQNAIFSPDRSVSPTKNRFMMGFVVNRLLLAYKNKPGFLEELVMNASPSLLNILQNTKRIAQEKNYATPEMMSSNQKNYIQSQQNSSRVQFEDGIIVQYGGGALSKPGAYDRYVPFENYPDADFLVIAWPMGLVQASCNPFKKERELKGVNLGEIAQEVLAKWEDQLKERQIPLSTIKWISETSKDFGPESVGFTFKDFVALYGKNYKSKQNGKEELINIGNLMEKPFEQLTEEERQILDEVTVNAWDVIQSNSGGHKCITNISGLMYMGRAKRSPQGNYKYDPEREDAPYIKFVKMIGQEFFKVLKEKIQESKKEN